MSDPGAVLPFPITAGLCADLAAIVARAGAVLTGCNRQEGMARKADGSIVTAADVASERLLRQLLSARLPALPIVAEESAAPDGRMPAARCVVLIDPLDGTAAFADGRDDYSVNLAIIVDGAPVIGILALPAQRRVFTGLLSPGLRAAQVWHHDDAGNLAAAGTPVQVRPPPPAALVGLVSERHGDQASDAALQRAGITQRRAASSACKFALIAEGAADLYPRFAPTMVWDTAAGQAVLEAAGGCVIDPVTGAAMRYAATRPLRNRAFVAATSVALARRAAGLPAA